VIANVPIVEGQYQRPIPPSFGTPIADGNNRQFRLNDRFDLIAKHARLKDIRSMLGVHRVGVI
jgi:hypothetical protein